jgi:transposase
VIRFNEQGPEGLINIPSPGVPPKLGKTHRVFLARLVEEGPIPAVHGVVRWRACDLIMRLHEEFGLSVSDDTIYRALKDLGFSHVSARPKAYKQDPDAMQAFKKTDLRGTEWVIFGVEGTRIAGIARGFCISRGAIFGMSSGWHEHRNATDGFGIRIRLQAFARSRRCAGFSVIRRRASLVCTDAQKNEMRMLWSGPDGVVRPQGPSSARSVVRGHADISGAGGAAPRLPQLRQGEEGAARLPGGQSALHQAFCLFCRAPLPAGVDRGRCEGAGAGLAYGEGAGDAVHAGPARARGPARPTGDWD